MKGKPGLIAVVLDDNTAQTLRGLAVHPNVHCKHITMAYRPSPEVYNKYLPTLGLSVEFDIVAAALDDNGQAVVVEGVASENAVPHVTISCNDTVKPSYSNTLFTNPNRHEMPVRFRGRGVVEYVRL